MSEEEKKGPGRPRKYLDSKHKARIDKQAIRARRLENMPQAKQRKAAESVYKTHCREIIDIFISCLEFKDKKPVVYADKMWQFHLNVIRAKGLRGLNLGGRMTPPEIIHKLDALRCDYYNNLEAE